MIKNNKMIEQYKRNDFEALEVEGVGREAKRAVWKMLNEKQEPQSTTQPLTDNEIEKIRKYLIGMEERETIQEKTGSLDEQFRKELADLRNWKEQETGKGLGRTINERINIEIYDRLKVVKQLSKLKTREVLHIALKDFFERFERE